MTTLTLSPARTQIRQYTAWQVLGVWAAAAVPMGVGAWLVVPRVAHPGSNGFTLALITALTAGLFWQFALVLLLVGTEQRTLRWSRVRDALWLNPPTNSTGRRGGRLWLWALALLAGVAALQLVPFKPPVPASRDFGTLLSSVQGHELLRGNWALYALIVAMCVFNTVLGEELLFRGVLLPRMRGAFGRADWLVNGLLFGLYHLHQPWSMPGAFAEGAMSAYATSRLRSAWMGIIAHSAQSVLILGLTLVLVLGR
jgi:membrane protease YdiL (CAAX protease family)